MVTVFIIIVSRRQRALAVVTCRVLHRWDSWSFLERGRNTATVAPSSKDLVSGTVYPLSCALQTFHRLCLETNWKLICSTSRNCFSAFAAPFLNCTPTCELALNVNVSNNNNNKNTFCWTRYLSHCCSFYRCGSILSLKSVSPVWPCAHDLIGHVTTLFDIPGIWFRNSALLKLTPIEVRSFSHFGAIST